MEVLKLLETYRAALRISKPRDRHALDPNEMMTTYYRLHANVAEDLAKHLPRLVQPDSWSGEAQPDAKGTVILVESPPDLFGIDGQLAHSVTEQAQTIVVSRSVLIVHQTRAVHEQIAEVIRRVKEGDATQGFGGGGGGFGGGFMSVPSLPRRSK